MISPLFVGLIADRYFSTERVLSALHLVGALFLYLVTRATSFGAVYAMMFAYCLCYFPTLALTASITLKNLDDAPLPTLPGIRNAGMDSDRRCHRQAQD